MQLSGTVIRASKRKTDYGSEYATVTLTTDSGKQAKLKFLATAVEMPKRGDLVTISGVPIVGNPKVNVGAATLIIH